MGGSVSTRRVEPAKKKLPALASSAGPSGGGAVEQTAIEAFSFDEAGDYRSDYNGSPRSFLLSQYTHIVAFYSVNTPSH